MSNENGERTPIVDSGTVNVNDAIDWATKVGRGEQDDVQTPLGEQVPVGEGQEEGWDRPNEPESILSEQQLQRLAVAERITDLLVKAAGRKGFTSREPVFVHEIIELTDYILNGDTDADEPLDEPGGRGASPQAVVVDEAQRFFADMGSQGRLFTTLPKRAGKQAAMDEFASPTPDPSFAELLDALLGGSEVEANILAEELQVGDLVTSHGDKVTKAPEWDGKDRWLIPIWCPKKSQVYIHKATVDERVDIYNKR